MCASLRQRQSSLARVAWLLLALPLAGCYGGGSSARNQSARILDGTNLPKNFDECVARDGSVWARGDGDQVCSYSMSLADDPALYDECEKVGGGISVADSPDAAFYYCDILYPEYGPICFGNYCD